MICLGPLPLENALIIVIHRGGGGGGGGKKNCMDPHHPTL